MRKSVVVNDRPDRKNAFALSPLLATMLSGFSAACAGGRPRARSSHAGGTTGWRGSFIRAPIAS